ncbi:MAG: DUF3450 domain-containing protein [Candidatus Bacteroides intestinipullorum]|uniref:DUF3450 domain-containing protein n=1 Tax=Candidatus Bacteroides intestinipullorum TaxID=2838471 RepID=A0A9E2NMV9_9BACE|nr:DUF3450 domain-containing protein [Candidatus Bacteroides intestinipullorum]
MRRILFTFLLCLTAGSALLTACRHADDAWMAQRQALFRLIVSVHNSGQEEIACKLDSLNRTALPADRHARALWQLAQAWLTASQTNRGIDDSLLLPVVDYLTQHGAPGEQVEALLLHARSLEWRGEMEQAQHTYSQALQVALKSGDPHTEMRCRQLLTSFYLQRTHLKGEGAQTARRFLQLAEACRDTAALALAHMYMGRLYFAAIHEDTLYNRPEEGVEHFRQATRLAALAKDQYLEMQSKYELAVLYMTLQQPFEALPLLKETKDYLSSQTPDSKQPILISLIQTYLQLDRPDSAQVYIDEAMTLPDRNNLRYNIYDLLFQYHRAKQQYARSVWAADSMRYYQPLALRQQLSRQVAEIKEKYDNEQLANERNRIRMERDRSVIIGLSLTVALLGIIILLTAAYRRRLRRIREQLRQDAIRLHDNEETLRQNSQSIVLLQAQLADEHQESQTQQDELQAAIDTLQQQNKTLDAENQRLQSSLDHYRDKYDTEEQRILRQQAERLRQLEAHEQALVEELIRRDSLVQLLRRQPKFLGEGEWKKLALLTDSIYNRFTVRLKERFPQLTDVDLQYCILIKLRFTVSQIAILMAVSPSSVSQQKSRLKKRLQQSEGFGLSPGEMLDSWLWKF